MLTNHFTALIKEANKERTLKEQQQYYKQQQRQTLNGSSSKHKRRQKARPQTALPFISSSFRWQEEHANIKTPGPGYYSSNYSSFETNTYNINMAEAAIKRKKHQKKGRK